MANTNTITALYNLAPQTLTVAATETVLTQVVNGVSSSAVLSMPPNANVDGQSFRVRLMGRVAGGTGATVILAFRLGTVITGTKIATFTTSAAVTTTGNFSVVAELTWDSVSGLVNGSFSGQTNNTLTALTALTQGTAVTSAAGLQFVATALIGGSLTTNVVSVEEFSLEQI